MESLFSSTPENGPSVCLHWAPLRELVPEVDNEVDKLRRTVEKNLAAGEVLARGGTAYPIRWHPVLDLRSHPERIRDLAKLIVEEWERMAPLVPMIDKLARHATQA